MPHSVSLAATRHHDDASEHEPGIVTLSRFACQASLLGFHAVRPPNSRHRETRLQELAEFAAAFWHIDLRRLGARLDDRVRAIEQALKLD